MSGDDQGNGGMTPGAALKVEYAIIGLGVLALLMIFQPFDITVFAVGCVLVVLAALANNLLPLAQHGVPIRSVVKAAMIIAMIFLRASEVLVSASSWVMPLVAADIGSEATGPS